MNKIYTFCCHRCGCIFDSTGDPDFCEDCRKVVYNSHKKQAYAVRQKCEFCGNTFVTTATERIICRECRARQMQKTEYTRIKKSRTPKPKKRTQKDLMKDVKAAIKSGLSYGEYMAQRSRSRS